MGKSTLLKKENTELSLDLLNPELQLFYNKNPSLLNQQIADLKPDATILVDEIQRVPKLLDCIHAAIEQHSQLRFILCGSSARKLRHGGSNLLGGRALYRTMHPLTLDELGSSFRLPWVLAYGTLPKIYSTLKQNDVHSRPRAF